MRHRALRPGGLHHPARRAAALAAVVASLTASPARAGDDWTRTVVIERRSLPDGTRIVVNPDLDVSSIVVCLDRSGATAPLAAAGVELERRGGSQVVDGSSACVIVPRGAAAFAIAAAAQRWKQPWVPLASAGDGTSPDGPTRRIRDLALEGAERPPAIAPGCITVVGGVPGRALVAMLEQHLGATSESPKAAAAPLVLHQTTERLSVLASGAATPQAHVAWAIPDSGDDEASALSVALELWAGGPGARLPRVLGGMRGFARELSTFGFDLPGGRISGISLELSSRASVDRVFRFIDGSLRRLRLSLPSRAEVLRARAALDLSTLSEWEDVLARARRLGREELTRGDARRVLAQHEALFRVTPRSIRDVSARTFLETRRAIVEAYPKLWPPDDPRLQRYRLYTAEDGDTLETVAARFDTTVAALCRANDLAPKQRLGAGQGIWVPPPR